MHHCLPLLNSRVAFMPGAACDAASVHLRPSITRTDMRATSAGRMYGKSGGAVQISASDEVVLSADEQGATTLLFVGCRAWYNVTEEQRPRCVSLVDGSRSHWYLRRTGVYLRVDHEQDESNFDLDSSFVLPFGSSQIHWWY